MKITTKGRYAVRCMLNLALHKYEESVPISRIAKEEGISQSYIEQLFIKLKRKKILKSIRGRGGGFALARKPEKITVAEIIETVEGPIVTVDCIVKGECERFDICTTRYLWERLSNSIKGILEETSLQDLCDLASEKMSEDLKHRHEFSI